MFLFEHLKQDILAHAERAFPEEACGVIYDGKYVPCDNVDPEPESYFSFAAEDEHKYLMDPATKAKTQAVVHSHPDGPVCPSEADMRVQISTALPCVLVAHDGSKWEYLEWGDHLLDAPLLERIFVHGAFDCFGLIRAWYWQERGVYLPDCARQNEWWFMEENPDLYAHNFAKWGFVEIDPGEDCNQLQIGDVFLYKLAGPEGGPKIESHGGVYVGNGMILHHLPKRLSREDLLGPWMNRVSRWVRFNEDQNGVGHEHGTPAR